MEFGETVSIWWLLILKSDATLVFHHLSLLLITWMPLVVSSHILIEEKVLFWCSHMHSILSQRATQSMGMCRSAKMVKGSVKVIIRERVT